LPEVIENGKTGFLADVGDVERMSRCAIEILSDDQRLQEMAKLARFEAQSRFCASKIIPQYEKFYQRVLERAS
jgi:L-malate glycosyltransferase